MVNRILSLIGWLGTALIFMAAAVRFGFPAREQLRPVPRLGRHRMRRRLPGRAVAGNRRRCSDGGRRATARWPA